MMIMGMDGKVIVILYNYEDKKYLVVLYGNRLWLWFYEVIVWKFI